MRSGRVWKRLVAVDDRTVVEGIDGDHEAEVVVVHVRPRRPAKRRCGRCERRAAGDDQGGGAALVQAGSGTVRVFREADAPRVACAEHGVVVAKLPWALHGAGFTRGFEEQAAWLATHTS